MAKVTCVQHFFDVQANHPRMVGDEFEVNVDRANELSSKGLVSVEYIEESVEPTQNKVVKPSKKK
jgi:hypothetical protein